MKKVFNKLVRDKIPEIIEENDEYSLTRTLNDKEYEKALYDKLFEEANEVINANKKEETEEELADLLEVVRAIADYKNIDVSDVEKLRISKKKKRGGFYKRIYLESTCDQNYIDENKGCLLCVNNSCKVPTSEKMHDEVLSLPIGPTMTMEDVTTIIQRCNDFWMYSE